MRGIVKVENELIDALRRALPRHWKAVTINAHIGDFSSGWSGQMVSSLPKPRCVDLGAIGLSEKIDIHFHLERVRKALRGSARGPCYHCLIEVARPRRSNVTYWCEKDPFSKLSELPLDGIGNVPMFPFKDSLKSELLVQLPEEQVTYAIGTRVECMIDRGEKVPELLFEIAALGAWLGSVSNGGFDQYFGRSGKAHIGGNGARALRATRGALQRLGLSEGVKLFDQGLRIYAARAKHVNLVCRELGLDAMPRQALDDDAVVIRLQKRVQRSSARWILAAGRYVLRNAYEYAAADPVASSARLGTRKR